MNVKIGVWILGWALLGGVFWWKASREQAEYATATTRIPVRVPTLVLGQKDSLWLLLPKRGTQVAVLQATDKTLQLGTMGEQWIGYQTDSLLKIAHPTKAIRWKRTLAEWLANPAVADTNLQWIEARQKLIAFVADIEVVASKTAIKDGDLLLFHRLVSKVSSLQKRQRAVYILDRELFASELVVLKKTGGQRLDVQLSLQEPTSLTLWYWLAGGCWVLMAMGIGQTVGRFWVRGQTNIQRRGENEGQSANINSADNSSVALKPEGDTHAEEKGSHPYERIEKTKENPTVDALNQEVNVESPASTLQPSGSDLMEIYLKNFYHNYGNFFDKLQKMQIPPTDEEHKWAWQQMAEMAIYAHTLAYAAKIGQLHLLDQKPNGQLLLNKKATEELLNESPVRGFSTKPKETEVKYRALFLILKELGVRDLNVVLEDNIVIQKNKWQE